MTISLVEFLIVALINLLALWLGVWVYTRRKEDRLNQWFLLMSLLMILWVDFSALGFNATSPSESLMWYRFNWGVVALFFLSAYNFYVTHFLKEKGKNIFLQSLITAGSLSLFFVSVFTDLIIKSVVIRSWGSEIVFGAGGVYFNAFTLFIGAVVLYYGFSRYVSLDKQQKARVQYFFIGVLIFVLSNIVFNVILPITLDTVKYQHFGDYSTIIFLVFAAYAMTRYRLFDVRVAFGRILIGLFTFVTFLLLLTGAYYLTKVLNISTHPYIVASIVLAISLLFYRRAYLFYEKLAGKYFYFSYYNAQQVVEETSRKIIRTLDLQILIEMIGSTISEVFKPQKIAVLVQNEIYAKDYFVNFNKQEKSKLAQMFKQNTAREDELLDLLALNHGEAVVQGDLPKGFERLDEELKNISIDVVQPMSFRENLRAIIVIGSKKTMDPYSQQDISLIRTLAMQAGIALENANLYQEVQELNRGLEKKVADRTAKLQAAYDELKQLDESKSQFLLISSHQLRTPLSIIKNYLWALESGKFGEMNEQQKKFIQVCSQTSDNLISLVNTLLDVTRIQVGKVKLDLQDNVDLEKILENNITGYQIKAQEKGLSLIYQKIPQGVEVPKLSKKDPQKLNEVFSNLLDNAIKYTQEGGVTVTLRKRTGAIEITVADTGVGIDSKDINNLFKPFMRSDDAQKAFSKGVGIGLVVAKGFLEAQGCRIAVSSAGKGKGTTFTVTIPV